MSTASFHHTKGVQGAALSLENPLFGFGFKSGLSFGQQKQKFLVCEINTVISRFIHTDLNPPFEVVLTVMIK